MVDQILKLLNYLQDLIAPFTEIMTAFQMKAWNMMEAVHSASAGHEMH